MTCFRHSAERARVDLFIFHAMESSDSMKYSVMCVSGAQFLQIMFFV